MTVDKENHDDFPVGMRVLAVDDDPICLKLLDTLLRKCHYHGMYAYLFIPIQDSSTFSSSISLLNTTLFSQFQIL